MDLLFFLNSAALGAGLAMDAFSVSLANGLHEPTMSRARICAVAGVYGAFQFAMPMIGWLCVRTIATVFTRFQKLIPWIALALLVYIGVKMFFDAAAEKKAADDDGSRRTLKTKDLLLQGVATSIDALSVGFTIADHTATMALISALIIGTITFAICVAGLIVGKKVGTKLSWKASVFGGCILIAIGIEIFVKGVFFGG